MKMQKRIVTSVVFIVLICGISTLYARPMQFDHHPGYYPDHRVFNPCMREIPHRTYSRSYISISLPPVRPVFTTTRVVMVPVVQPVTVVRPVVVEPVVAPVEIVEWIRNDNGSLTSVRLKQQGPGYIGPMGEYYSTMPTEEQLKVLYGLKAQYN